MPPHQGWLFSAPICKNRVLSMLQRRIPSLIRKKNTITDVWIPTNPHIKIISNNLNTFICNSLVSTTILWVDIFIFPTFPIFTINQKTLIFRHHWHCYVLLGQGCPSYRHWDHRNIILPLYSIIGISLLWIGGVLVVIFFLYRSTIFPGTRNFGRMCCFVVLFYLFCPCKTL